MRHPGRACGRGRALVAWRRPNRPDNRRLNSAGSASAGPLPLVEGTLSTVYSRTHSTQFIKETEIAFCHKLFFRTIFNYKNLTPGGTRTHNSQETKRLALSIRQQERSRSWNFVKSNEVEQYQPQLPHLQSRYYTKNLSHFN